MRLSTLAGASAPALVGFGALFALLVRRAWRVRVAAAAHRKRRLSSRAQRAWVQLTGTWHAPLLLLGLTIATARLAFFADMLRHDEHHQSIDSRRCRWLWLELPNALLSIAAGFLLFFFAHVALFRVWSIRWRSTAVSWRILLCGFASLLVGAVVLVAYEREADKSNPMLTPHEWTKLSLLYFAAVWIVLGALLLKFQGLAAEVMWSERELGRLLVLSPSGLHAVVITLTTFSLVLILRGVMFALLALTADEPMLPSDPANIKTSTFIAMYGAWEVVALGTVYALCGSVPINSRTRRLVGLEDDSSDGLKPILTSQPILHFSVPSPKLAVEGYLRSATAVMESRARIASRRFEETSGYEPFDGSRIEADDFHEPLLLREEEEQDDEYDRIG